MTEITAFEFVEKYKLIPKKFRKKFTYSSPSIYEDEFDFYIFDNLITILRWHQSCTNGTNYKRLEEGIIEEVYYGKTRVYNDVITHMINCLKQKTKIKYEDIIKFRKKQILKQIKNEVAYRPGNPGYELAKSNFERLCQLDEIKNSRINK